MDRRAFVAGAVGLALAPRALAGAGASAAVALVTADLESRLIAVDLESGRVRGHVRTLASPRSIETVGNTAVVAHSELGVLSLVRGRTLAVAHVLRGFGEPRYTAAHPDGRHAYVTDAARGELIALDVPEARVLARIRVGARARHVGIDPSGHRLWVALGSKAKELALVDVTRRAAPRLVGRLRPPFLAHDVGWAPGGARVWVSSGDRNELAVYDATRARLLTRIAGDAPPQHVTFNGDRVYVTSGESGTLRVHRVDGRALRTTRVPTGSYNVQQARGWVVTPGLDRGSLCVLDRSGRLVRRLQVAKSSHDVCVVLAERA
jgi:DNA-binding beta-propeller fold protein YncE